MIVNRGEGDTLKLYEEIEVEYTGWYRSGEKFASSQDRIRDYKFKYGFGAVIKGWDMSLNKIRKGGKMYLQVPPHLGFEPGTAGVKTREMLVFGIWVK